MHPSSAPDDGIMSNNTQDIGLEYVVDTEKRCLITEPQFFLLHFWGRAVHGSKGQHTNFSNYVFRTIWKEALSKMKILF